jgi:hypothetical protein
MNKKRQTTKEEQREYDRRKYQKKMRDMEQVMKKPAGIDDIISLDGLVGRKRKRVIEERRERMKRVRPDSESDYWEPPDINTQGTEKPTASAKKGDSNQQAIYLAGASPIEKAVLRSALGRQGFKVLTDSRPDAVHVNLSPV